MKPAAKIIKQVRRGVQSAAYGNVLYQKILESGDGPDRLHFTLPDLWPGDAQAGQALIAEQRQLFSDRFTSRQTVGTHLRNLRAVGSDNARQVALWMIEAWLDRYDNWHETEWAPEALGERIASWIGFYEFYSPSADLEFIEQITASLHKQWKHLVRLMPAGLSGVAGLQAIRGVVYGALNFEEDERTLGLACDLLKRQLSAEILPDGGHIARNPSAHFHVLQHLADLRAVFKTAGLEVPEIIRTTIAAMTPVLKFFRHGDGGLSLFHGSAEETALRIDSVITQTESRGRNLHRLPQTGYERVTAGRSILIADTAKPAPRGHDTTGHAGLLSFEFTSNKERLIVNCGAVTDGGPDWRMACAATAAHSTLIVEDTNACEIFPTGITPSSIYVTAQRYEQAGTQCLEITHDAYRNAFGVLHQRLLGLSPEGDALHGREVLSGTRGRSFVLRWHLHPLVQASLMQSGQSALLRTPSGNGWRFRIDQGELGLEPSIYCGNGAPRRSLQLKVSGVTDEAQTALAWSLIREKKG